MSIEELVKKHFDRWVTDTEFGNVEAHMRAALTEQAETHALELRAYEATVQNLEQRVRELEAQRVPEGLLIRHYGVRDDQEDDVFEGDLDEVLQVHSEYIDRDEDEGGDGSDIKLYAVLAAAPKKEPRHD